VEHYLRPAGTAAHQFEHGAAAETAGPPPNGVVPYKFPAASNIRPAEGKRPAASVLKLKSTVSCHLPFVCRVNWKTLPLRSQGPANAPHEVPYKFPPASKIRPSSGQPPFSTSNSSSNFSVQLPFVPGINSKTVPYPSAPPIDCRPV
jgi:hypothetical protein